MACGDQQQYNQYGIKNCEVVLFYNWSISEIHEIANHKFQKKKLFYLNYMSSSMNKHGKNLSMPTFGCCFRHNFINLKTLMIFFQNTCVVYDKLKGCRSGVSDSGFIKNDL